MNTKPFRWKKRVGIFDPILIEVFELYSMVIWTNIANIKNSWTGQIFNLFYFVHLKVSYNSFPSKGQLCENPSNGGEELIWWTIEKILNFFSVYTWKWVLIFFRQKGIYVKTRVMEGKNRFQPNV